MAIFIENKRFILGNNISYLDFYLFEIVELIDFITEGGVFENYPDLQKYQKRMSKLPKLKKYLGSEDCLKAPFHM